jgi:hypothetical protein
MGWAKVLVWTKVLNFSSIKISWCWNFSRFPQGCYKMIVCRCSAAVWRILATGIFSKTSTCIIKTEEQRADGPEYDPAAVGQGVSQFLI